MNIGRNEILIGVAVLAVAALIVVPILVSNNKSSRLEEVERTVQAIRKAELDYHDAFGEYVSAEAAPRPSHAVDPNPVPWVPSEGFRKLSWGPDQDQVIGSYQVQADKDGFKVVGSCDVDGDGQRAIFEATQDTDAHQVTESGIY
jgi:type II secretory pathway pseudopilin PulG